MSMEMNKAPVEQAGGDERAEFERAFTVQEGIYFDDKRGEYRSMNLRAIEASDAQDLNLQLQGWQARAALAHRAPEVCSECSDTGKVYDESGDGPWSCYACTGNPEVIGYANGDELDNMLDDRTAVLSPGKTSFHSVPVYRLIRAALAQRSEFHRHLKECADEVATWPSYKREALTQPSPKCATCNDSSQIVVSGPHYQGEFQPPEYETEPCDMCAQPSPAPAEQAEAERPEVVARVVHSNPVVLGQCGPLNANDELMTVAQHAASVARWAEMFNRVEQQRDAALARVAELTATRNRYGVDAHYFNKNLQRILRDFESFTPDELARSLIILAKVADEKVVAQAQHSVPELLEWAVDRWHAEVSLRPLINVHRRALDDTWRQVIRHLGGDTGLLCGPSHDELLAAAPGNSVPQAWLDVQAERRRQVEAEGWTPEHDDLYCAAELPRAAAAYILNGANDEAPAIWPFVVKWWKPRDARSNYVRAGALILAEIERLDRAAPGKEGV